MIDEIVYSVHNLLVSNLPIKTNKTPSGWITMDCPMCSDTRKRGGVITNGTKISYHCFNCNYTTGWSPSPHMGKKYKDLCEKLGATSTDIHAVQLDLLKNSEVLSTETETDYVYSMNKFNIMALPDDAVSVSDLPDNHALKQYAKERGILGLYPLYHFTDTINKKRLIVPFFYNNELIGWTGRHINPPDKETPKYLHNMQSGYVFNIDKFVESPRDVVVVTEGVFDAILIDGVSVLGNSVTAEQAYLIEKLGKRVILCPDRDSAGKELIDQALELGWEVSFPPWHHDCKDAADAVNKYTRLGTLQSILSYATANKIKAQVKSKLL